MDTKAIAEAYFNVRAQIEESQARVSDAAEALLPLVKHGNPAAKAALDNLRRAAVSMEEERTRSDYLWRLASGQNPPPPAEAQTGEQSTSSGGNARPRTFLDNLIDDVMGAGFLP